MSRRRSPALRRRPSRTVPATLTALVLLAVGVLSALAAVLRLVQGRWPAPAQGFGDLLASTTWGSPAWVAVCAVVTLLGLVLLVAATKAGTPNAARLRVPSGTGATATEMVISCRGVARLAAARADAVDGVDSVDVSASPRRVRLRVRTTSTRTGEIEEAVTERVTRTLADAGLDPVPRVSTTARTKEI